MRCPCCESEVTVNDKLCPFCGENNEHYIAPPSHPKVNPVLSNYQSQTQSQYSSYVQPQPQPVAFTTTTYVQPVAPPPQPVVIAKPSNGYSSRVAFGIVAFVLGAVALTFWQIHAIFGGLFFYIFSNLIMHPALALGIVGINLSRTTVGHALSKGGIWFFIGISIAQFFFMMIHLGEYGSLYYYYYYGIFY